MPGNSSPQMYFRTHITPKLNVLIAISRSEGLRIETCRPMIERLDQTLVKHVDAPPQPLLPDPLGVELELVGIGAGW